VVLLTALAFAAGCGQSAGDAIAGAPSDGVALALEGSAAAGGERDGTESPDDTTRSAGAAADASDSRSAAARRAGPLGAAMAAENGLEIRKIVVQDEDGAAALALTELGQPFSGEGSARLQRNGFQLVRLAAGDLDLLIDRLSLPLTDLRTWHGQAPSWRDLLRFPARAPVALVADGRPRVISDGTIRLLLRAWTLPMEDGALLEVQIRTSFEPTPRGARLLAPAMEQITGAPAVTGDVARGEPLGGAVDFQMGAGDVWVLSCTNPRDARRIDEDAQVRRDGLPARSSTLEATTGSGDSGAASSAPEAREPVAPRGPLPDDHYGPRGSLPPALGALLLSTDIPATRTLYLLIARLPEVATAEREEVVTAPVNEDIGEVHEEQAPASTALPPASGSDRRTRGGER
jgi:hypothetical protein